MGFDISVVIPLYNKQAEIARCLRSVQAQTLESFEVIIIDDGSTDEGPRIASPFCDSDKRIRMYRQDNHGVAAARNRGVALARAKYIAFLDADDEFLPGHLAEFARLAEQRPEAGMLFSAYWVDRGGGWRRRFRIPNRFLTRGTPDILDYFGLPDGYIQVCSVVVRKDAYQAVGGQRKVHFEDFDMDLRMAAAYPVVYSQTLTSIWHVDAGNRFCVQLKQSANLYTPGGLGPSLAQIVANESIPPATKDRAIGNVVRREKRAITGTLFAGEKSHGRFLYDWWQKEFNGRSILIETILRFPVPVLRLAGKTKEWLHKLSVITAYCWDLPANFMTFHNR